MKGYFEDIKPLSHRGGSEHKPPVKKPVRETPSPEPLYEEEAEPIRKPLSVRDRELQDEIVPDYDGSDRDQKGWGGILWKVILVLILVGGLVYGLSYYFKSAVITITPKSVSGTTSLTLTLSENGSNGIAYQLVTLPESHTKNVTATHTDVVATKAKGTVVLYNSQSTSQSLVATTRFTDATGTLFRLQNTVTIPKQTVSGSTTTPGQVTVTLVADQAGTSGNVGLSDFTVVAFKGTAKEKQVYGRGKTAFTGGASGPAYFLTDDEYTTNVTPLTAGLEDSLKADILKQVPEGYVLLPNSLAYLPDPIANPGPSTTASITVSAGAKERGILVKKSDLSELILNNIAPEESATGDDITADQIEALTFASTTDLTQAILPETIPLSIDGDAKVVWNVDQAAIKENLKGVSRRDFAAKMQGFSSVKEAALTLTPFWMSKLPTDVHKITVKVAN